MTVKEGLIYIYQSMMSFHNRTGSEIPQKEKEAFKLLNETCAKYRWHDLRKEPYMLPKTDEDVLVYHTYFHHSDERVRGEVEIGWYNGERWGGEASLGQQNTIIAWMPFPQFEEAEE